MESAGLPVKILPGLFELVDGKAEVSDIREVDVADLLGRDPVPPEPGLFARNIAGKVVMVTGAGGSIGSELCRQIASQQPAKLVLLDHSEFALYTIDRELHQTHGTVLVTCLGSVLDDSLLRTVMRQHGVQTIYHAAAYKHVPIVESNMQQGLRNNVFGTLAIARAALDAGAEDVINDEGGAIEVLSSPHEFEAVKAGLEQAGLHADLAEVTMRAENTVPLSGDDGVRMQKLIDVIEDLDDVQALFHNAEISE